MSDFTTPTDPPEPPEPGEAVPPPPPPPAYGAPAAGARAAAGDPPLAEIGKRGVAALIDYGLLLGASIVLGFLVATASLVSNALGSLVAGVGYVALLGFGIWNFYVVQGSTGQTIGKKMQGIKLVSLENGQPIGGWMAFARYFISSLLCGLGFALMFFDSLRQQLGDKVTKSVVIDA